MFKTDKSNKSKNIAYVNFSSPQAAAAVSVIASNSESFASEDQLGSFTAVLKSNLNRDVFEQPLSNSSGTRQTSAFKAAAEAVAKTAEDADRKAKEKAQTTILQREQCPSIARTRERQKDRKRSHTSQYA